MDFEAVSIMWAGMLECEISETQRISIYKTNPGIKCSFSSLEMKWVKMVVGFKFG